ncbi:MAG: ankyrin repeat domain-containing protein [Allosphingosinicella sp.]
MKLRTVIVSAALACAGAASAQTIKEMQLTAAAQDCRASEVSDLLAQRVNVNARNSGGYTPLMLAAGNGCESVVRILLGAGADPSLKHDSFGDAAAQARLHRQSAIVALLDAARPGAPDAGTQAAAAQPTAPLAVEAPAGGATAWPRLGHYRVGQDVLYSGTAGKTWDRGRIKSIDPQYGYNIEGVTGSTDAFFVVGTAREPYWTSWFVGDWRVSVPMAMGTVTDGRHVYRTVSGGLRLPPLRINADGTYSWRVQSGGGEKLVKGRWLPNPDGPGVVLKNAEQGADWLVYNNTRTGSSLGETVILSSDCCTHYDGTRLR